MTFPGIFLAADSENSHWGQESGETFFYSETFFHKVKTTFANMNSEQYLDYFFSLPTECK